MNLYDILEVSPKASKEVIEKAYKVLCKKYHPDLHENKNKDNAEEKMKMLNDAYNILIDDEKRLEYDQNFINQQIDQTQYKNQPKETIENKDNTQPWHNGSSGNIDDWKYKNIINSDLIMMVLYYIVQDFNEKYNVNLMANDNSYQRIIDCSQNAIINLWHNQTTYIYLPRIYKMYDIEMIITREMVERIVEFYSKIAEENDKKERQRQKIKDIFSGIIFILALAMLIFNLIIQSKYNNFSFLKRLLL